MQRRELLQFTAILGLASTYSGRALSAPPAHSADTVANATDSNFHRLTPPPDGRIPVAVLLSENAVVIDFGGPWEVFRQVRVKGPNPRPFELYTVAETTKPLHVGGALTVLPNYTINNAPLPKILVIPAQDSPSEAVMAWIRKVTQNTDVTMSVCTGAFVLAKTGLLSGKPATTWHGAYEELAMAYPDITVKRGARFVETRNLATAGGLSSGIDLALRVVERYFGREVALGTAFQLEYQGMGWTDPDSNSAYVARRVSTDAHPLCPVCQMDVDLSVAPKVTYRDHVYYFCMEDHKKLFEASPQRFIS
jgi:transcriptional regulator GlxA family with amidase domain/YHS domain-containing protein